MKLSDLHTGESGIIVKIHGRGSFQKRIIEMGFVFGKRVKVILNAPLQDPIEYEIIGYKISLRREEADNIEVVSEKEAKNFVHKQNQELSIDASYCDDAEFLEKKWNVWRQSGSIRYGWHWLAIRIVGKHHCLTSLLAHTNMLGTIAV